MYKQRDDEEQMELPFFRPMKLVAILCAILSAVLLLDFVLPSSCSTDAIEKRLFEKEADRFGGTVFKLHIKTNKSFFEATPAMFEDAVDGATINVCTSPIFQFVKQVEGKHPQTGKQFLHAANAPIYKGYCAFPITLLILSLFTVLFKKDEIVAYCSGIITIVLVISVLIII
jgi:hypothetical protein